MAFPKSRILTTERFVQLFLETKDKQRFCFILGAGASVDSGIKAGNRLEMIWMNQLMGKTEISTGHLMNPNDTRTLAKHLYDEDEIEHNFEQIEKAWELARDDAIKKHQKPDSDDLIGPTLSSEFYFDLYKLRFHPNPRNGYRQLEKLMENATPSTGYHALALTLTKDNRHNLVITTNFDSLSEDALFIYTRKRPLVVGHESLATYIDYDAQRPIIAKVHRGLMFDPFNSPDTTDHLREEWNKSLDYAFKTYTPIVIGYAGGDGSLMTYLKNSELSKGIYWCYMEEYGLPSKEIQQFVRKKNGCFVKIKGFDKLMMQLGTTLYPNDIGPDNVSKYLHNQSDTRHNEYKERWNKLSDDPDTSRLLDPINKSEEEARKKRAEEDNLTYLDHFNLAYAAAEEGKHDTAIQKYTLALEKDPNRPIAYNNRGVSYRKQGKTEQAIADYSKAIGLDPKYTDAYYNRGLSYHNLKQYERAIQDYGKAIELDPNYAAAYNNRGNSYADLKQYERAIQDYDKAIELDPNDTDAYNNRGSSYFSLEQYERAIRDYNRAIELNPNVALAYYNRGNSYEEMEQYELAIRDYDKAIELGPNDADAYNSRAFAYAHIEEFDKSISDIEKSLSLSPDDPYALHTYGFIHLQQEDWSKAIEYFNRSIEYLNKQHTPNNKLKIAYEDRAKAYRAQEKFDLAEADEAKAAELEAAEKKDNP